ncbi:Uncharacterised protein [uncultured archaeon]|nr:Uncharacterised protein [uncultured archaeon]
MTLWSYAQHERVCLIQTETHNNLSGKKMINDLLLKYSKELSEKYFGEYIAIVEDKLAAVSESRTETCNKAKKLFPDKKISLVYMPTDEETVTLL